MLKFDTNDYAKEIEMFLDYMKGKLHQAWDEENKGNNKLIDALYNSKFQLTFEGATLDLYFGACEFQSLEKCLEDILEENK